MSRLHTPASIEAAPAAAQPSLQAVAKQLGSAPNLFRVLANSPAALDGYLGLSGALAKGALDPRTRARLTMVVAEANGCDYCLSAHTYLGLNVHKLEAGELSANRRAESADAKSAAALRFAAQIVRARGHVSDAELAAVKAAGFDDAQVLEIILHVVLNTLTNYVNSVAATDIDFPVVRASAR